MLALTILKALIEAVPAAAEAYQRIRDTLSQDDLGNLDAALEVADDGVTIDHDMLAAAITAARQ